MSVTGSIIQLHRRITRSKHIFTEKYFHMDNCYDKVLLTGTGTWETIFQHFLEILRQTIFFSFVLHAYRFLFLYFILTISKELGSEIVYF